MLAAILHNAVLDKSAADEKDVLVQVAAVSEALQHLGHRPMVIACDLNLSALKEKLLITAPDLVVNLVESLGQRGALIHLVPFLLEALQIPFTGAPADAMLLTSNKIMAKTLMHAAGLPTPDWLGPYPATGGPFQKTGAPRDPMRAVWIIKSVWEHASIGLEEDGLLHRVSADEVLSQLALRANNLGGTCFAEMFIDGREFNLSILDGPDGPVVLPPAEIQFVGYGPEKPRIVGYRAKWDSTAYEYHHTPRRFDFPPKDRPLLSVLKKKALAAWRQFGLKGYARVDFRVDSHQRPWILEINANPCLSPDAGFAAALAQAGIGFHEAVGRIIETAKTAGRATSGRVPSAVTKEGQDRTGHVTLRTKVLPEDTERIGHLVEITGFFNQDEIGVAMELVQTYLTAGPASGYNFILAEQNGRLVGYVCYGPIACTASAYDLYWIAAHPDFQRLGLGSKLLIESEKMTLKAGGTRMYVETSQRDQYAGTRAFYERHGYRVASVMEDFYAPGDSKTTYCKVL